MYFFHVYFHLYSVWLLLLVTACTQAMPFILLLYTIDDIPHYCTYLAAGLANQQLIFYQPIKFLPLVYYDDARIVELMSTAAQCFLGSKQSWPIKSFNECPGYRAIDGGAIPAGIQLYISPENDQCSLDQLSAAYCQVIEGVKNGWYAATLEQCPTIMVTQDENNWYLLVKDKVFVCEDVLIRFLASKFHMSDSVQCYDRWRMPDGDYRGAHKLYMWIKKETWQLAMAVFKLRIL